VFDCVKLLIICSWLGLLVWLHRWEKQDFFDVVSVCQQHGKSVNAHSPSSCWWQSILKSLDEAFI